MAAGGEDRFEVLPAGLLFWMPSGGLYGDKYLI
jgi:hypothetical protein